MTKQEYYDLLVQCCDDGTFPSSNENRDCLYRGPGNKRCAIGLLIPDDKYNSSMEGVSITSKIYDVCEVPEGLTFDDLAEIQNCHDSSGHIYFKDSFLRKLNKLKCFEEVKKVYIE